MTLVLARFGRIHLCPKDVRLCFFEPERKTWLSASKSIAPRGLVFDLAMLCGVLVSRRCRPSRHPGTAKQSRDLITATPGSSPIYATGNRERWVKTRKFATAKKSAAKPQDEEKEREREKCRWAWPLDEQIADLGIFHRCHTKPHS